jgi:phage shock protein E
MTNRPLLALFALVASTACVADTPPANPLIDFMAFQRTVRESTAQRETRRLDEQTFLAAMREPGVVVLDARSAARYTQMHLEGAVSLPFTDFTAESLAAVLPDKRTKLLIYCNNNFRDGPVAFPTKLPAASLNLSTWAALWGYGYRNVWELAPAVSVHATTLPLVGTERDAIAER